MEIINGFGTVEMIINDAVSYLLAATRVESLRAWLEDVDLVMSNVVVNSYKDKFWDQFWSFYGFDVLWNS